jgi:hypothetical protein
LGVSPVLARVLFALPDPEMLAPVEAVINAESDAQASKTPAVAAFDVEKQNLTETPSVPAPTVLFKVAEF